eukprot:snap_masked-scaffold_1-processed-gene-2.41-mRNA-1 protein AED:0.12 eAED:0.14 QI:0/0/0/1/1/1/2/0/180
MKGNIKRGAWTQDEDKLLIKLMQRENYLKHKDPKKRRNWKLIESAMSGRSAKQCRERWVLCLDPNINKSSWSEEEDEELLRLQRNKWAKIKVLLKTNRTENSVKLRYLKIKKPKKEDISEVYAKVENNLKEEKEKEKEKRFLAVDMQPKQPVVMECNSWKLKQEYVLTDEDILEMCRMLC